MNQNKLNISVLAEKLTNNKWLISPTAHANLTNLVNTFIQNPSFANYNMEDKEVEFTDNVEVVTGDSTAIIYVSGVLVKGASEIEEEVFGLVNTDYIRYCLEDAVNDSSVKDIIMVFSSPGGETTGIEELGRKILEIDSIKPVYAWTESAMCSAAYWLGSAARKVGMTPSSIVGSIGVYSLIEDCSKALEQEGINIQSISAGKFKLLGAGFKPLTPEEKDILQTDVNTQHEKFKSAVTSRRQVPIEYMEGLGYEGQQALLGNLVDVVVDDMDKFINNISNMKDYKKVTSTTTSDKNAEVIEVDKKMEASLPGVPMENKEPDEPTTDKESSDEVCPHCGKKCSDPVEPDGDEVEPKDEKKMAVTTQTEVPKQLNLNILELEQWNSLFGRKKVTNPFVEAAYTYVKENSSNTKI